MSASPVSIRVAIVEDIRALREGYRALIDGTQGYVCTGCFRTMEDALQQIGVSIPDIVLIDIGLPGMSGIAGIPLLREKYPKMAVVMLTVYDDDEAIFES